MIDGPLVMDMGNETLRRWHCAPPPSLEYLIFLRPTLSNINQLGSLRRKQNFVDEMNFNHGPKIINMYQNNKNEVDNNFYHRALIE